MRLTPEHFSAFFSAVHGPQPFPWQERLLRQVLLDGWPKAISLPTASGKTGVMDIAVFALACSRAMPRRIALVVDRRIVVNDAFTHARLIRNKLMEGNSDIIRQVAAALRALGGEDPLSIAELRGGIYSGNHWIQNPAQPMIICSTVDQVGSRLLHRGYGVSSSMWPVHAGLLGNDALIVLDEAHCSNPFAETLAYLARFRGVATHPLAVPFTVVEMTATPHATSSQFQLDHADRQHRTLSRRLTARKLATLQMADNFPETLVVRVEAEAKTGRTVLVTVNRVATARTVAERLKKRTEEKKAPLVADVILLTGRVRVVERDALLEAERWRLMAGRDRNLAANEKPLIVVATQCVEVGADFDVDVLVTECCPLDALRQRVGRLDRLGHLSETKIVIVCRKEQAWDGRGDPPDDTVYGPALARAWSWLNTQHGKEQSLDLGTNALDRRLASMSPVELKDLSSQAPHAPVIFPAYCDLWVQTGPEPSTTPEPALFLHGPARGEPEVRFIWRGDLGDDPRSWADTVALCPPVAAEGVSVRLSEARGWLTSRGGDPETADIEGQSEAVADNRNVNQKRVFRSALRWSGPEKSTLALHTHEVRPGDTLVIPCKYGGCDDWGWNPGSNGQVVADCADLAREFARRAPVLRLHPALLPPETPANLVALASSSFKEMPHGLHEQVQHALKAVIGHGATFAPESPAREGRSPYVPRGAWWRLVFALVMERRLRIELHPSGRGLILSGAIADIASDFTVVDSTSSSVARKVVWLMPHLEKAAQGARQFGQALGLPPELVADLTLAAYCHDFGKADQRFQIWLAGGSKLTALRYGLLAKSSTVPVTGAAMMASRCLSRYPEGARHELISVRLLESSKNLLGQAHDRDLVLHLIESHHGRCRAFAPVVVDDSPVTVSLHLETGTLEAGSVTGLDRLGSGVTERFWRLIRRYGWWGLSYLEACVRLADHWASEASETGGAP